MASSRTTSPSQALRAIDDALAALKRAEDALLEARSEALSHQLDLQFADGFSNTSPLDQLHRATSFHRQSQRVHGDDLTATARTVLRSLDPQVEFTTSQFRDALLGHLPGDQARQKHATVSSLLRRLSDEGIVKPVAVGRGRTPTLFASVYYTEDAQKKRPAETGRFSNPSACQPEGGDDKR